MHVETVKKIYRIDRREISFLRFIFEAYEGLAVITTLNAEEGTVQLSIAPECVDEVDLILNDLKKDILMEHLN